MFRLRDEQLQELAKAGKPTAEKCPAASPDQYGKAIKIEGDDAFRRATIGALDHIKKTPSGKKLFDSLDKSGKQVTIRKTEAGNELSGFNSDGSLKADGTQGKGSDSTVLFNPVNTTIGSQPWETRPPA